MSKLFTPADRETVKSDKHQPHTSKVQALLRPEVRAQLEAMRRGS